MTEWLYFLAALFAYLALDAWRLATRADETPYAIEAKLRGEGVDGVPLQEQARRKAWHRRYGVGDGNHVGWLWLILAIAALAGAFLETP